MNKMPYKDLYIKGEVDCPYCGSQEKTNRTAMEEPELNMILFYYQCIDCRKYWTEEYTLKEIREVSS